MPNAVERRVRWKLESKSTNDLFGTSFSQSGYTSQLLPSVPLLSRSSQSLLRRSILAGSDYAQKIRNPWESFRPNRQGVDKPVQPNAKLVTMARACISDTNSNRKNERGCPCLGLATIIIAIWCAEGQCRWQNFQVRYGAASRNWFWTITAQFSQQPTARGYTATRDEATTAFRSLGASCRVDRDPSARRTVMALPQGRSGFAINRPVSRY